MVGPGGGRAVGGDGAGQEVLLLPVPPGVLRLHNK